MEKLRKGWAWYKCAICGLYSQGRKDLLGMAHLVKKQGRIVKHDMEQTKEPPPK